MLLEYYESGNAPHEALGRAARRLSGGGALYLGGGIGIEKVRKGDADTFNVTKGSGKAESFVGPLSAVIRAFTLAGSSTGIDSPGGATAVTDPAAAARLRELKDEEAECERDISRFETRLARRQRAGAANGIPWSPVAASDDQWEARRIEELKADLTRIRAERSKLLSTGKVEEAEAGKPGTNWKQVTPDAKKKLSGILAHYRKEAHPFTACVRDNTKRFGKEGAERVCAVVKDLNERTTKWRKGSGKLKEADELIEAALGRLGVVEEQFGAAAMVQLAEGIESPLSAVNELSEAVTQDFALLAMAGHPLALAVFGVEEGAFDEAAHPRDLIGRFKRKVAALAPGESVSLPDGHKVTRVERSGRGGKFSQYLVSKPGDKPGTASGIASKVPEKSAMAALDASARSAHGKSLGGSKSFRDADEAASVGGSTLNFNPKTKELEGSYRGVKLEKGVAYQFTIGKNVHTVRWNGTIDTGGEPVFVNVDNGELRSAAAADSFERLSDVKPAQRNELARSYDAGRARQAEVDRIKALSPGAAQAAADHSPSKSPAIKMSAVSGFASVVARAEGAGSGRNFEASKRAARRQFELALRAVVKVEDERGADAAARVSDRLTALRQRATRVGLLTPEDVSAIERKVTAAPAKA